MIINTNSISELEESLASYFNITKKEFYSYLETSYNRDYEIFKDNLRDGLFKLEVSEEIDEIYLYHLSRRLDTNDKKAYCLRDALVNDTSLKSFLEKYGLIFKNKGDCTEAYYNGELLPLNDESIQNTYLGNLSIKLGYSNSSIIDNSFNGFIFKENLKNNSNYYRTLEQCPEFIRVLSYAIDNTDIINDYYDNSNYYCYTYKFPIDEILFAGEENLDKNKKIEYFIMSLCYILIDYNDYKDSYSSNHEIHTYNNKSFLEDYFLEIEKYN